MKKALEFIYPDWSVPENVRALTTTRVGGCSKPPFDSLNLSMKTGDGLDRVEKNRALVVERAGLPSDPVWLRQTHSADVVDASFSERHTEADGSYTDQPGVVCVVLTADCCPVFLCDRQGNCVAVLHAGWRGLVRGIVEEGIRRMDIPGGELVAWLGPAIGPAEFEVGDEVHDAFIRKDPAAVTEFCKKENGRWLANIYGLVRLRLRSMGVHTISGGSYCTVQDRDRFFSYRRDRVCGHMASLIWLETE